MIDLTAFRVAYPEFSSGEDALIQATLDRAALSIDSAIWGTKTDIGHGLYTAHLLALSPYGQMARMVNKDGSTTYGVQYYDLRSAVACGMRVI